MKTFWMILVAAAAGGAAAWAVWQYADRALKSELQSGGDLLTQSLARGSAQLSSQALVARSQVQNAVGAAIQQQVIPVVRATVQQTLASQGITPELIAEAKKVLAVGQRVGII